MKNDPDSRDPRSRRGGLLLLGGIALLVLVSAWQLRAPRGSGSGPVSSPPDAGESAAASAPGDGPGPGTGRGSARAFRRAAVPPPGAPGRPPWHSRIRTNGPLDTGRLSSDPAYARQVRRHMQLRALLRSPARDTPECAEVIALAERHRISLAAVPELYHALWEHRGALLRERAATGDPGRTAIGTVGQVMLKDFMRRFETEYEVDPQPIFEELVQLPVEPTVYFGGPDTNLRPGETLLAD